MSTETAVSVADSADLQKIFVDRKAQRNAFDENPGKILTDESRLIYYAGVGGVGKTALIRELESSLPITSRV